MRGGCRAKARARSSAGTANLFYRLLGRLSSVDDPGRCRRFPADRPQGARCLPARCRSSDRFVRGMVAWLGFRQTEVAFHRLPRAAGETKYPLWKMIRLARERSARASPMPHCVWRSGWGSASPAWRCSMGLTVIGLVAGARRPGRRVVLDGGHRFLPVRRQHADDRHRRPLRRTHPRRGEAPAALRGRHKGRLRSRSRGARPWGRTCRGFEKRWIRHYRAGVGRSGNGPCRLCTTATSSA